MVKKAMKRTFEKITPNNFDKVISKINKKEGEILEMKEKNNKTILFPSLVALGVVVLGFIAFTYYNNTKVFAKIGFDVNPSVELVVNKELKVMNAVAQNEDGKLILGTMDFKGSSLEVATNALVGSMLKNGFIDETKNSILLSVESNYKGEAEKIRTSLAKDVENLLKGNDLDASVMSQLFIEEKALNDLADEYDISVGKMRLINEILTNNNLYKIEDLIDLNINELNLLATSKKNNVTNVNIQGTASDKTYIGENKAKEIAFSNAKVNSSNVTQLEVEFDLEDGIMVYEVEFYYNNIDYDYEINALTGAIIKADKEIEDEDDIEKVINNEPNQNTNSTYISKSKAKEIALKHAGVNNVKDYSIEFEHKAGKAIYEIEFEVNNKEYDYEINAQTGDIIKSYSKNDVDDDYDDDDRYDDEDDD